MGLIIDLKGQRFGRLLVLTFCGRLNKHSMFRCVCDCGNMTIVTSNNLRRNHTTSCGCFNDEKFRASTRTHGLRNHPLYMCWIGMRNRCYYKKHNRYQNYGGKGIEVCDEWVDNFKAFYIWGMKNGWKRGLSIDRKENDKHYCPENCKFSTIPEQNRNRTTNIHITVNGITRVMKDWATIYGISQTTIKKRIKNGLSPSEAVLKKPRRKA